MFKKRRKLLREKRAYETKEKTMQEVFEKSQKSSDFTSLSLTMEDDFLNISYYQTLVDMDLLNRSILPYIKKHL